MNRKWLKYLVPICASSLTAGLLLAGHHQARAMEKALGGSVAWAGYDGPPPPGYEIAGALNLPAIVLGVLGLLPLGSLDQSTPSQWRDVLIAVYFSLLVVAQWVFIGRWLSRAQKSTGHLVKKIGLSLFIYSLGILASLCLAWLGVDLIKHQWMSTWIKGAALVTWSLIFTIILTARIRRVLTRQRGSARQTSDTQAAF